MAAAAEPVRDNEPAEGIRGGKRRVGMTSVVGTAAWVAKNADPVPAAAAVGEAGSGVASCDRLLRESGLRVMDTCAMRGDPVCERGCITMLIELAGSARGAAKGADSPAALPPPPLLG